MLPRRPTAYEVVLLALSSLGLSCTYAATEVLVVLNTDAPAAQALTIVATVRLGTRTTGAGFSQRWVRGGTGPGSIRLPASFGVVPPLGGDLSIPVTLVVDASLAGVAPTDPAVQFRVVQRFSFTLHQTTVVRVFLSPRCGSPATGCRTATGAACTVGQLCEDRMMTCGEGGRCVAQVVIPEPVVDSGVPSTDGSRTDARGEGGVDVPVGMDVPVGTDVPVGIDVPPPMDVPCGGPCPNAPRATGSCVANMCRLTCDAGFADCDGTAANGCETDIGSNVDHCGRCGNACPTPAGATRGCSGGVCGIACTSGRGDCNGTAADGCEVNLDTTVAHCGACGRVCNAPNAMPTCGGGRCDYSGCNNGFADVDGNRGNGCECATDNEPDVCGSATGLGMMGVGGARTVNGNIAPAGDSDWFEVTFAPGGSPRIQVVTDPGGTRIDVSAGCGAAVSCMSGSGGGITDWQFTDVTPPPMGGTTRDVPYPGSMRFRVHGVSGARCGNYAVRVSN